MVALDMMQRVGNYVYGSIEMSPGEIVSSGVISNSKRPTRTCIGIREILINRGYNPKVEFQGGCNNGRVSCSDYDVEWRNVKGLVSLKVTRLPVEQKS